MGSYQRGTTITLEGWFTDERTGSFVDPDNGTKSLVIYFNGAAIETIPDGSILKLATGKYYYEWDTSESLTKGLYVYEWSAEINGKDVVESAILRIKERKST